MPLWGVGHIPETGGAWESGSLHSVAPSLGYPKTGIGGGDSFLGLGLAFGVSRPLGGRVTHLPKLHVCLVPQTNKSETAP